MSLYRINGINGFIQLEGDVITVHRDDRDSSTLNTYRVNITSDTFPLGKLPRSEKAYLSIFNSPPREGEYLLHDPENDPLSIMLPRTLPEDEVLEFMRAVWSVSEAMHEKEKEDATTNVLTETSQLPVTPIPETIVEPIREPEEIAPVPQTVKKEVETHVSESKKLPTAIPSGLLEHVHELEEAEKQKLAEEAFRASQEVKLTGLPTQRVNEKPKSTESPRTNCIPSPRPRPEYKKVETSFLPVIPAPAKEIKKLPPLTTKSLPPVPALKLQKAWERNAPKKHGTQWLIDVNNLYVKEYVVVDIETTGLDAIDDRIIELAAIRYIDDVEVGRFSSLVRPYTPNLMAAYTFAEFEELAGTTGINYIEDPYITKLTGITNNMLMDAPTADQIAPAFFDFIGNLPVVGHNFLKFDLEFLREFAAETKTRTSIGHDIIDTFELAERFLPHAGSRSLNSVAQFFGAEGESSHRALDDALQTAFVYHEVKKIVTDKKLEPFRHFDNGHLSHLTIISDPASENDDKFAGKTFVFTGNMKMYRGQAMQHVVNRGGILSQALNKKTNYLVVSDNDDTNGSSKLQRLFQYKQSGQDLSIIKESAFYELIGKAGFTGTLPADPIVAEDPALEPAIPYPSV